ncbi:peptidylprolyl isomerase [Oligoflexus tunisiensis]|uniref:peptidylprolyl isomerase n=1 Tax=Oligoflexus tunisiensis TaxID=708132 RepID=UPI000B0A0E95|nr:peptidylprolyl isomerase [Oligoflexus tunisiensis]
MTDVKQQVKDIEKTIDFNKNRYQVNLTTNHGPIHLEFFPDVAPGHVKNLISLTKAGFYDGLTFHRVIKGFMIQGGCPKGSGIGGPGYTIPAEFNNRPHEPGVLSMARTNDPNSAGSQFFICLERVPYLDGQYTVFGRTADKESLDTVKKIGDVKTGPQDRPIDPVTITKAEVVETPL